MHLPPVRIDAEGSSAAKRATLNGPDASAKRGAARVRTAEWRAHIRYTGWSSLRSIESWFRVGHPLQRSSCCGPAGHVGPRRRPGGAGETRDSGRTVGGQWADSGRTVGGQRERGWEGRWTSASYVLAPVCSRAMSQACTRCHREWEVRENYAASKGEQRGTKGHAPAPAKAAARRKTYNSRDSLVVTHPTTNLPI